MQQHAAPLITTNSFGESEIGKRLDYTAPKYRDPIFAVCYILHVLVVLAAGIYIWAIEWPSASTPSPTYSDSDTDSDDWSTMDLGGIVAGLVGTMVVGVLFGICWLQVMKKFAMAIIKGMLFFNIGIWVVVGIVGLAMPYGLALAVIGFILAAVYALYTWCIWSRIPFASVMLSISSTIVSRFQGTIMISLAVVVFNLLWLVVWASCAGAYFITVGPQECTTDPYTYETTCSGGPNRFVIFLLLVSMYWGFQVNKNVSHTTTCGVAATWYFSTVIDHKPTPEAFKRTMTTSFGSVCLGSLIVAFLQAVRAMLRGSKRSRSCLTLIALCLLGCIERLIRYFNKYAFAQCAIYGSSFIQSAKATWNLFMTRGILAIINDDLTGMALMCGCLIGGVVSAGAGFGIGYMFYSDAGDVIYPLVPILLAVVGFFIGLVFCQLVMYPIVSAVICLFVCYAEDPAAMNTNRPEEYNRVVEAKPTWGDVYRTYGGAQVAPVMGPVVAVQHQQPQYAPQGQQVVYVQQPQQLPQTQGQVTYVQPQQQGQQVVYAQPPQGQHVVYVQPQQQGQQPVAYAQPPMDGNGTRQ